MKVERKRVIGVTILVGLVVMASCCLWNEYKGQSKYVLNEYLKAMNSRDYKYAVSLIHKDERLEDFSNEELISFMYNYFEEKNFVKVEVSKKEIGVQKVDAQKKVYEVKYIFKAQKVTSTLSLVKVSDRWEVVFPFKMEDVHIYTPLGSSVWFGQEQVTTKEENKYIVKNVLPGNYVTRITFPDEVCEDYITTINVPSETEVVIPYQMVEVSIECMSGTVVELSGEKQVNKNGFVCFENVLEGVYPLKIYDQYGNIEPYEEHISVSQNNKQFKVEELTLSALGNDRLRKSVDAFYNAYLEGIKTHESEFITQFATPEIGPHLIEAFEAWFIKGKDVQDAKMEVEIQEIKMTKEGSLEVETLEVVKMRNKEIDAGGKVYEQEYQVTLKWIMELICQGDTYKLKDRSIEESLVSYKDKDGKWIAY
ncbi:MAG: hypothetical protein RR448_01310 [Niameybacter sp.]|uniref:hypothetical protein n=1 Tax=Niameybacter sp. TaxID=2033640 RepID=UPI002FCAE35F